MVHYCSEGLGGGYRGAHVQLLMIPPDIFSTVFATDLADFLTARRVDGSHTLHVRPVLAHVPVRACACGCDLATLRDDLRLTDAAHPR